MKIDLHTHILPREWPDLDAKYGYAGFVRLEHYQPCCARMMIGDRVFREITDNVWDPKRRIEEWTATGVSMQVLSTVPVMFSYWAKPADALDLSPVVERSHRRSRARASETICRARDDSVAGSGPGGAGAGTMRARAGFARRRDRHARRRQRTLSRPHDCRNLDHRSLDVVWNAAEQLGAAIFVHPWDMVGKERMPKYWLPWLVGMPAETSLAICSMMFGGVFERFPKLRVAFAHGGGAFPVHDRPDRARLSCPAGSGRDRQPDEPAQLSARTATTPGAILCRFARARSRYAEVLLKLFGAERVALGSDYPFPLGEASPRQTDRIVERISEGEAQLLSGTAREFLGL